MYSTFEDFLNKNYNRDITHLDKCRGNEKFKFIHEINRCSDICTHTNFGIRCNGTAIRKKYIDKFLPSSSMCSFPRDINVYKGKFIPIESSNKRW